MAVGVDSCGYSCYYERLLHKMGLQYDDVVRGSDGLKDKRRTYHKLYREDEVNRRRRGTALAVRIKRMVSEELRDKRDGRFYESGIGGPSPLLVPPAEESTEDDRKMHAVDDGKESTNDSNVQNDDSGK